MTPSSLPSRRHAPRRRPALLLAVLAVLSVAACSGDDDDEASSETTAGGSTTAAPTTAASDEEPPGTDPEAVEPYIQDLLSRYDEVVSQITADAAVAANVEGPLYEDLRSIMAPTSDMTDPIVQALQDRGEQGVTQRAHGDSVLPVQRSVDGDVQTVSPTEVTFPLCARFNYEFVRSDGQVFQVFEGRSERSQGSAVRVDGHWLINRLDGNEEAVGCEEAA